MVFADGTLKTINQVNTPLFKHYLINFGGLGIITHMTMKVMPRYMVYKSVYHSLKFKDFIANYDEIEHKKNFVAEVNYVNLDKMLPMVSDVGLGAMSAPSSSQHGM